METIIITAIICLSIIGINVVNKDISIKKAELIGKMIDKIMENADSFDDDSLVSLLLQIKSSLD